MIVVITGGSNGIGKCAVEILKKQGNEVVNVDIHGGDICADIGTPAGRAYIIRELHERYPDGIDGLISNAAIAGIPGQTAADVLSVNYFGAVTIIEGLFDLLQKRSGNCAVTCSASISYGQRTKYVIDDLLVNCEDEERIREFASQLEQEDHAQMMYVTSKFALARWVRRKSAAWAARGVIINAVAPGGVDTTIIPNMKTGPLFDVVTMAQPMPTVYYDRDLMRPESIAKTLAFLVTPEARGNCGAIVYCDGGSCALIHPDIYV